ncbi:MAG TPA: hypothetical protein VGC35_07335 [Allosphingosinicella sp.]|jgi:hypothetical protein
MPKSRTVKALGWGAALVALSAQADPGKPRPGEEIVVTGSRESEGERRDRAAAYVRALGVGGGQSAVARWIDPVCLRVIGIGGRPAQLVQTRLRAAAAAAGVPIAAGRCSPNLTVSFVSDAGAVVRRIAGKSPSLLREVPAERLHSLRQGDAPIRWWYMTELRGRDGDRLSDSPPPAAQMEGGGLLPTGPDGRILSLSGSSLVSTQSVRTLRSATVIVDVDRAAGASLSAVADYAALIGFAEIRFGTGPRPGSILTLFDAPGFDAAGTDGAGLDAAGGKAELTAWDKSFLCALYRIKLDRLGRYQRGRLAGAIAEGTEARCSA